MKLKKRILAAIMTLSVLTSSQTLALCSAEAASPPAAEPEIRRYRLVGDEGSLSTHFEDEDGNRAELQSGGGLFRNRANPLPEAYDARDDGLISYPKDQSGSGACWAFSTISCLETAAVKAGFSEAYPLLPDFSEDHLIYFTKYAMTSDPNDLTYGDGKNVSGISEVYGEGAYWYEPLATLIRGSGPTEEKDYPYLGSLRGGIDEAHRYESLCRVDEFVLRMPFGGISEVKELILKYGSFNGYYYSTESGYNKASFYYPSNPYRSITNHAVTVVGWDDDYPAENFKSGIRPKNNGAWLVKNSWGLMNPHVDHGYTWISYEEPSFYYGGAYSVTSPAKNIYQYDVGIPDNIFSVSGLKQLHFANVYRGEADEKISDVSFYTFGDGERYTVRLYRLKNADDSPSSGELLASESGTLTYMGYHSIKLSAKPEIKSGEYFAVAVELTDPSPSLNSCVYLVSEGDYGKCKENQSYYSVNGESWCDMYETTGMGNLILRAIVGPDEGGTTEEDKLITAIAPAAPVTAAYGTEFSALGLPKTLKGTTALGETELEVTWDPESYSPTVAGEQTVTGSVTLPSGYALAKGVGNNVSVKITVLPQPPQPPLGGVTGDADGDGEVTDWDDVLLQRYLADWDDVEIELAVMDIDGDGYVSDWDDVLLQRYLAGWQTELAAPELMR